MIENELKDLPAERAIISGCVKYGSEVFVEVEDLVTDRSFTLDSNQIWYKCLRHMFEQDSDIMPDISTLLSTASSLGFEKQIESKEEKLHLRSILNMPVEKENVRKLAAKVRKLEIARCGLDVNKQIENGLLGVKGDESISSILNLLESPVFDFVSTLSNTSNDSPKAIGEDLEAWVAYLEANPIQQSGFPSGYKRLDKAIGGGLRKGSLTTIAARSGHGKSSSCMNIAMSLAAGCGYSYPKFDTTKRIPVLCLDTEMGIEDHRLKNLANLSNIEINEIETGQFGKAKVNSSKVWEAAKKISLIPYHMKSIAGQQFEETLAIMRRWIKKEVGVNSNGLANDCVIFYDYIKLMDASGLSKQVSEFQALGFIMTGLHNFAVRYQVPIVCFGQLNREGIDSEESNAMSGSDRILHLTSDLIYYKPQSDEELASQTGSKDKYTHKFVVVKNRHGKGLARKDYINVKMEGQYGRITEGPLQSELKNQKPQEFQAENVENVNL